MRKRLQITLILGLASLLVQAQQADTSTIHRGRLAFVLTSEAVLYGGSMAYLQYVWYQDKERVPFHFYDDRLGYKQMDKMGHVYGAYVESYIGYQALRWAGVSKTKAIWLGGTLGFWMQLPIEIWDGMYEGWGFSWSDVAANGVGALLVMGQAAAWDAQHIKYKFSFSPSPYAKMANGYLGSGFNQLLNDYNGHTYWLSGGLHHLFPNSGIPKWLNVAVGYSAGGMFGEFENRAFYRGVAIPETQRYRQFLLSLDIDWTQIKTKSKFWNGFFQVMFPVKLPFPALEWNTKNEWRLHGLYY
jgi:hypothetical protein